MNCTSCINKEKIMSLNNTPSSERLHIGFFGLRNAGKSSLVNAVTAQKLSLVSEIKGTTTDPVRKAMELLPLGPIVIIDTPGLDDEGALGQMRVSRARDMLSSVHIAVIVADALKGLSEEDKSLAAELKSRKLPFVIAMNKADLLGSVPENSEDTIYVSAEKNIGINELKEKIAALADGAKTNKKILSDLVAKGDTVMLVTPIDESAPKGRLILPQQQTIRELLESGCISIVVQVDEITAALSNLKVPPKLVITDSQAFGAVAKLLPENEGGMYMHGAVNMLRAMEKCCNFDPANDHMLDYGTVRFPVDGDWKKAEVHISIIYGDYFYTEAILKLLGSEFFPW